MIKVHAFQNKLIYIYICNILVLSKLNQLGYLNYYGLLWLLLASSQMNHGGLRVQRKHFKGTNTLTQ